jgi:hypothetical protein
MTTEAYSNRNIKKKSWEELVDMKWNEMKNLPGFCRRSLYNVWKIPFVDPSFKIGCTQNLRFLRILRKRENKKIKAPNKGPADSHLLHAEVA